MHDGDGFYDSGTGDKFTPVMEVFKISVTDIGNMLTTADGYPVLDENGMEIIIDVDVSKHVGRKWRT